MMHGPIYIRFTVDILLRFYSVWDERSSPTLRNKLLPQPPGRRKYVHLFEEAFTCRQADAWTQFQPPEDGVNMFLRKLFVTLGPQTVSQAKRLSSEV